MLTPFIAIMINPILVYLRYSFALLLISFIHGCNKIKVPNDTAAQLSGRYDVRTYVLNGDTLLGNRTDKFRYSEFYIDISRKSADSLLVTMRTKREGATVVTSALRTAGFKLTDDSYGLSYAHWQSQAYESEISGQFLYEKTPLPGSFLFLPENYTPKSPADPNLSGVVIVAEKQPK